MSAGYTVEEYVADIEATGSKLVLHEGQVWHMVYPCQDDSAWDAVQVRFRLSALTLPDVAEYLAKMEAADLSAALPSEALSCG